MSKHKVRIVRRTPDGDDQRIVVCSCGFRVACLYAYEARAEKERHLRRSAESVAS